MRGYADDLPLTDDDNANGITTTSATATDITAGSITDVDMKVKIEQTKVIHVLTQTQTGDLHHK